MRHSENHCGLLYVALDASLLCIDKQQIKPFLIIVIKRLVFYGLVLLNLDT